MSSCVYSPGKLYLYKEIHLDQRMYISKIDAWLAYAELWFNPQHQVN